METYQKLILEEREKALRCIWKGAWRMELLDNSSLITGGLKSPELIGIMDSYIQKTRCGYKYMFITVNPRPGTELDFLVARMSKFLRKCWVSEFIYCYEQRGDVITTPLGSELHVHILVKLTKYKRPSDVKRETWNTFKNCCGNKQHVLVKPSMESTNFVNYIMGEKKKKNKILNTPKTLSGDPFTCRSPPQLST